jgi:hypothetical protein
MRDEVIVTVMVATKGTTWNPKLLSWNGETEFKKKAEYGITLENTIDQLFEHYGLDTTELPKILIGIEDSGKILIAKYRLEVDPLSLLEFLISEEGRESGLELIDLD